MPLLDEYAFTRVGALGEPRRSWFEMSDSEAFVDHYFVLGVHPKCDEKTLEAGYRHLAKMYHPDHRETSDVDKFKQVIEAYRVLRHPEQRAQYDILHAANASTYERRVDIEVGGDAEEQAALDDAAAHAKILVYLYNLRRKNAQNAGVAGFYLQEMLKCSDEHFEFHRWYLKAKGLIETNEQGALAITIDGIDHVISLSRTAKAEKRLITRADDTD